MGNYRLEEVKTAAQARRFLDMAEEIYRGDLMWVRPLDSDLESVFDPAHNPLFQDGEAVRWLLTDADSGKTIGRIAAFYNRELAATGPQPTGGCGFFECIDDRQAADTLFDAARQWLRERGMEAMDGSVNFGDRMMWWGVLVEGFTLPLYGMNYNPPYYAALFENYGFQNYFNQHTYYRKIRKDSLPEAVKAKADRLFANPDYRFRNPDMKNTEKVARDFMEVYNSGWAAFSGVKPMDLEHALQMVRGLKPIVDPRAVFFAYYQEKPIGFFIMIPDLNLIIRKFRGKMGLLQKLRLVWDLRVRHKVDRLYGLVFGVAAEFQGRGIESGMIRQFDLELERRKLPYHSLELAWIGDFNPLMMRMAEKYVVATQCKRHVTYRYLFDREKAFVRCPVLKPARRERPRPEETRAETAG